MLRSLSAVLSIGLLAGAAGCTKTNTAPTPQPAPYSQTDLTVGTGTQANAGNRVTVSYTGWLYDASRPDNKGSQFDSGNGFAVTIGVGQVIKGWDQGVPGMRVGGQRRLVLPPELGYGSSGSGPIPPNASLVFDITLIAVQ